MSEHGFHLDGLLRAAQQDIGLIIVWSILLGLIYLGARLLVRKNLEGTEQADAFRLINIVMTIIVILSVLGLVVDMTNRLVSNRMPRSDVDASAVYQQMESHTSDSTK